MDTKKYRDLNVRSTRRSKVHNNGNFFAISTQYKYMLKSTYKKSTV